MITLPVPLSMAVRVSRKLFPIFDVAGVAQILGEGPRACIAS